MKNLIVLLTAFWFILPQVSNAHGDHEHIEPQIITENVAILLAQRTTTSMTKKNAGLGFGQLGESWASIPTEKMSVHKKDYGYYVVAVPNSEESQTLYVLMTDTGRVYDANMTGEFKGVR